MSPLPKPELTARQLQVLRKMRDEDEELVYSKGTGYIGYESISRRTVFALLRAAAIRLDSCSTVGEYEIYAINETGKQILVAADQVTGEAACQ